MGSYDLTRKLTRGIYTALTASALSLVSLSGCDKYPIDPLPTELNNPPSSSFSVSPTSGISPLEVRVQGSCTDIDGDLKEYKIMSGGNVITRTNPIDTLVTLTQDASFNSYCADAKGNISNAGPVSVTITQPPLPIEQIAFWSNRPVPEGGYNEDIYSGEIVYVDGVPKLLNTRRLTTNSRQDLQPTYSPDGNEILFTSTRTGRIAVWRMNSDGSNQRDITSNIVERAMEADWCSNGKIVVAYRDKGDSEAGIGIISPNENTFTPIYSEPISSQIPGWPKWSPDCSSIAFHKYFNNNYEIYTMSSSGNNLVNLTNNSATDQLPFWSLNGNDILFKSNISGNTDIYLMSKNGTNLRRLTSDSGIETDPKFSPEGIYILFTHDDVGFFNPQLYLMNSNGVGNWTQLTFDGANRYPAWRPIR